MQKKIARIVLILVGAFAVAIWLPGQFSSTDSQAATPAHMQKAAALPQLTLKQFDDTIKSDTRPTLLFFYASWCPHCRIQMPDILKLEDRRKRDVKVLYVSIDEDPVALVQFLERAHTDAKFTPYVIAKGEGRKFAHYLRSRNSNFRGGVPYSGLFDPNTRLTHEFIGRAPLSDIEAAIDK